MSLLKNWVSVLVAFALTAEDHQTLSSGAAYHAQVLTQPQQVTGIVSHESIMVSLLPQCFSSPHCHVNVVHRVPWQGEIWSQSLPHGNDSTTIERLFTRRRATVVVNEVHEAVPELDILRMALQEEVTDLVGTNLYYTPPGSQGFEAHFDTMTVLVVQVLGEKTWWVCQTPEVLLPRPDEKRRPAISQCPHALTFHLSPGDVLVLPRGYVHEAASRRKGISSAHVSFGFECRYNTTAEGVHRMIGSHARSPHSLFRSVLLECGGVRFTMASALHLFVRMLEDAKRPSCVVLRRSRMGVPWVEAFRVCVEEAFSCQSHLKFGGQCDWNGVGIRDMYILDKVYSAALLSDVATVRTEETWECMSKLVSVVDRSLLDLKKALLELF